MINVENLVKRIVTEMEATPSQYVTGFRAFVADPIWAQSGKFTQALSKKELAYLQGKQNLVGWFLTAYQGNPHHFDCGLVGWTVREN